MELLTLDRFLYLLSFNLKKFKKGATLEEALKVREDFVVVHTYFIENKQYTDKLRLSILGKCASTIPHITRHFKLPELETPLLENTVYKTNKRFKSK